MADVTMVENESLTVLIIEHVRLVEHG